MRDRLAATKQVTISLHKRGERSVARGAPLQLSQFLKTYLHNTILYAKYSVNLSRILRYEKHSRRIYLFDPSLLNSTGHHFNAYELLNGILTRNGFNLNVFGNCKLDHSLALQKSINPHFSRSLYENLSEIYNNADYSIGIKNVIRQFFYELISTGAHKTSGNNIYVFPTIMHFHLGAIDQWVRRHGRPDRQILLLWLLFDETFMAAGADQQNWGKRKFAEAFAKIDDLARNGTKIIFVVETQAMADHFRALTDCPITLAPLPYGTSEATPTTGFSGHGAEKARVTFAGNARREKGFFLLPDIIEQVWESEPGVNFTVQTDLASTQPEVSEVITRLQNYSDGVELVPGALSMSAYYDMLKGSDILLLPYDPKKYQNRGSGIALEGLGLGIPTVLPAGASFAVKFLDAGMATSFKEQNANEVSKAVIEAVRSLPTLRQNGSAHLASQANRTSEIEALLETVVRLTT